MDNTYMYIDKKRLNISNNGQYKSGTFMQKQWIVNLTGSQQN